LWHQQHLLHQKQLAFDMCIRRQQHLPQDTNEVTHFQQFLIGWSTLYTTCYIPYLYILSSFSLISTVKCCSGFSGKYFDNIFSESDSKLTMYRSTSLTHKYDGGVTGFSIRLNTIYLQFLDHSDIYSRFRRRTERACSSWARGRSFRRSSSRAETVSRQTDHPATDERLLMEHGMPDSVLPRM